MLRNRARFDTLPAPDASNVSDIFGRHDSLHEHGTADVDTGAADDKKQEPTTNQPTVTNT